MTAATGNGWALHCAESLAFMRAQPPASFDGVITDPPYSSGGQFRGDRTQSTRTKYGGSDYQDLHDEFAGDARDQKSFMVWTSMWVSEAMRICKPGSPVAAFTDWRQLSATIDAMQAGGLVYRGVFVWDKTAGSRPVLGRPRNQCEFAVWGSFGPMPLTSGALLGCMTESVGEKLHQTGKPVRVMRELVRMVPAGGTVLDPFCGSGSTGVASIQEGRQFVGVEMVPSIFDVAARRLAGTIRDAAGQPSLFEVAS